MSFVGEVEGDWIQFSVDKSAEVHTISIKYLQMASNEWNWAMELISEALGLVECLCQNHYGLMDILGVFFFSPQIECKWQKGCGASTWYVHHVRIFIKPLNWKEGCVVSFGSVMAVLFIYSELWECSEFHCSFGVFRQGHQGYDHGNNLYHA